MNLRVSATGVGDAPRENSHVRSIDGLAPGSGTRPAYFGPRHGLLPTPVVGRAAVGSIPSRGPLIVEEYDATTVVPPGSCIMRDDLNNLIVEVGAE